MHKGKGSIAENSTRRLNGCARESRDSHRSSCRGFNRRRRRHRSGYSTLHHALNCQATGADSNLSSNSWRDAAVRPDLTKNHSKFWELLHDCQEMVKRFKNQTDPTRAKTSTQSGVNHANLKQVVPWDLSRSSASRTR